MVSMTFDIPEGAFASLHKTPDEFGGEMRLAAAVKWYELQAVSPGPGSRDRCSFACRVWQRSRDFESRRLSTRRTT